ncbi:hypothetical protein [Nostoc sp. TCL26-01]|nr:hypothetical protein [Nostoc sp. TCL26-01]
MNYELRITSDVNYKYQRNIEDFALGRDVALQRLYTRMRGFNV